jgi:hypothetical protein
MPGIAITGLEMGVENRGFYLEPTTTNIILKIKTIMVFYSMFLIN